MIGTLQQWQRGQIDRPQNLPEGATATPVGYFQNLSVERPFYTDPNNPGGSRNYGAQRVAAPVLGQTASGMRYYASFAGYDNNGDMLWDFSRPNLGQPDMNWTPTLDPYVQAEQERNANPDPLGRGPRDAGTFTDPRTIQPPTTGAPPIIVDQSGTLGPGNRPPPMAEPVDPITGGPRVPLPNEPVLPPGSVFMPPPTIPHQPSQPQQPQQPQQPNGLFASFGYAPGPAGGLLPIMLGQGMNPFQNQQPQQQMPSYGITDPVQLAQMQYNPNIEGVQFWQPQQPPASGGQQPPATGGGTTPGGAPPVGTGGYSGRGGFVSPYNQMERSMSPGLLSMYGGDMSGAYSLPPALAGMLK